MGGPAGEPLRRMAGDFGQMISVPWPHLLLVKGTNQQSGPFRHLTEAAEELGSEVSEFVQYEHVQFSDFSSKKPPKY